MNYNYPIDPDWSTEEMVVVVEFLALIEKAYESSVSREKLLKEYQAFKKIVPSKSEEKTIGRKFEQASGFSIYQTIKKARSEEKKNINMR